MTPSLAVQIYEILKASTEISRQNIADQLGVPATNDGGLFGREFHEATMIHLREDGVVWAPRSGGKYVRANAKQSARRARRLSMAAQRKFARAIDVQFASSVMANDLENQRTRQVSDALEAKADLMQRFAGK